MIQPLLAGDPGGMAQSSAMGRLSHGKLLASMWGLAEILSDCDHSSIVSWPARFQKGFSERARKIKRKWRRRAECGLPANLQPHFRKKYLIEKMRSGAAFSNFNNDGRLDIFLVRRRAADQPTAKGKIPQKTGPDLYSEPAVPSEGRRSFLDDVTERRRGSRGTGEAHGVRPPGMTIMMATKICT